MNTSGTIVRFLRKALPSPFTIAVLLTGVTMLLAFLIRPPERERKPDYSITLAGKTERLSPEKFEIVSRFIEADPVKVAPPKPRGLQILTAWEKGFWELLEFAMQMVLILVLGHALALTKPISRLINSLGAIPTNTAQAAALVSFSAIVVSLVNWGLGLIFGAILARRVGERFAAQGRALNYALIGAAGYAGLMAWHGGLSGSAPLSVVQSDHFLSHQIGSIPPETTLFSPMNMSVTLALLIVVPMILFITGRRTGAGVPTISSSTTSVATGDSEGTGRLDKSRVLGYAFAMVIIGFAVYKAATYQGTTFFSFLQLNYVNFVLLGVGLALHGNFARFLSAVDDGVRHSSGIIIQFPIYAGIMGIMKYTGLVYAFSDFFIRIADSNTLPLLTFISAAVVNVFVPSGGGQWAVQGPIVMDAANQLSSSVPKNVMALSYGDQLTNMIQPFWALPLLAITGLSASRLLPYTFLIMLIGIVVFVGALLIF